MVNWHHQTGDSGFLIPVFYLTFRFEQVYSQASEHGAMHGYRRHIAMTFRPKPPAGFTQEF